MVRWVAAIAVGWMLSTAAPARAVIGTNDTVPAATLLYPYFEVDLANPNGVTTLLAVQNASATAILGHFTLWTDLGFPTLVFDIYLTGYDAQTVNLRDVFDGNLPRTASAGQDPQDTISPHGDFSQDINFASCNAIAPPLPFPYANPAVTGAQLSDLRAAHRGLQADSFFGAGKCGAIPHGDEVVRGYVTVDTTNQCSLANPTTAGYFGFGVATTQNVMLGDYAFVNPSTDEMQADTAVHIEADSTVLNTFGIQTFYSRLASANDVTGPVDFREPLPNTWAASYQGQRSELVVWRDASNERASFNCTGTAPGVFLMSQNQVVGFDMESNGTPVVDEMPFPSRAGVTRIGPDLDLAPKQGWAYLNLNTSAFPQRFFPKQSWVTVRRQSTGWSAVPLGSVLAGSDEILIPNP